MLLILIPTVWFALAALVVLLCRMAARSDALLTQTAAQSPGRLAQIPRVTLASRARWHEAPYLAGSRKALAWSSRGPAARTREGRCIAGS
jgi:hypothetical protein